MNTQRIVILGFMACGKTTVGRELARQFESTFVDLDSFIAERHGRSPAEIIQSDGEVSFRKIETLALRDILQNKEMGVIALGGGTWTIPANRTLLALFECTTVWLDAPFELCWKRIDSSEDVRPLAPNRVSALDRFHERAKDYALADSRIQVSESDTPELIAGQILRDMANCQGPDTSG